MTKLTEWLKALPWKKAVAAFFKTLVPGALAGALGGALAGGCTSLQPADKTQSMRVYALGIPGVAVITSSTQNATNGGDDLNETKNDRLETQAK